MNTLVLRLFSISLLAIMGGCCSSCEKPSTVQQDKVEQVVVDNNNDVIESTEKLQDSDLQVVASIENQDEVVSTEQNV